MTRRAKIIATLGPSSSKERIVERILKAGADLIRLNLSHGAHGSHSTYVDIVRQQADRLDRQIPLIFDLMGPRYRIAQASDADRTLRRGARVRLGRPGMKVDVPIDDSYLLKHVKTGERILIDNGLVELKVVETEGDHVIARVVHGGPISSRKGINLPDSDLPFEISEKDRSDIALAVELGIDFIAASYVGRAADVESVRKEVQKAGGDIPVIAKLERSRAIANIDEITDAADAVMAARGDLGVEVELHRVPVLQKQIVEAGRRTGTPVIVATQMLDSMMSQPRPTRAETSDVANAVFDGADPPLLTGETAAGSYPVKAVQMMARIIVEAEAHVSTGLKSDEPTISRVSSELRPLKLKPRRQPSGIAGRAESEIADSIARAAVVTVQHLGVRQIVAFSKSGFTARLISRYRPDVSILAFVSNPAVARSVQMYWGVRPILVSERCETSDEVMAMIERHLADASLARSGHNLIVLMAEPLNSGALTNVMRVHRIQP